MGARFATIIAVFSLAYGFLLFHLYEVQLMKGGYYAARAASQAEASNGDTATRGAIYFTDVNGNTLPAAVNEAIPLVYAVPASIADAQEAANELSPIVNIPTSNLLALFSKPNDQYETVEREVSTTTAQQIENLNLTGIYTTSAPERVYPFDAIGAQLLGFVGPNALSTGQSGHYGIELYYNDTLAGTDSGIGSDVTLTIDPNVQAEAEKVLDDLVKANDATGGNVLIEDPQTGKILAMGSVPTFDPNDYQDFPIGDFTNPMVQSVYEPGSILKVLTMAAGIDAGKITPDTTYDDKGYVDVNHAHITNYNLTTYGAYGPGTTMTEVLEHSINTGAIFAENQTGNAVFTQYMKKFGFDQKTGIDLPGEITGNLSQLNPKSPQIDFDTAAYGQGIAMTPIELVTAVDAIANHGVMMRPYLNAALQPEPLGSAISANTASEVTQMMVSSIDKVPGAPAVAGYSLAGKTGSAFIPDLVNGGYTDKLTDSYIGFGPTTNPKFIVFIRLNTLPQTSLAVSSVVPAWKTLVQYLVNYYNIPPDRATN